MSKTFAERFKGKIEEVRKQGLNQIVSSSVNPLNKGNLNFQYCYSDNIDKKDNQKFAKNAQVNILDFQKNFNRMVHQNQPDRIQNNQLVHDKHYPYYPLFVPDVKSNYPDSQEYSYAYNQHRGYEDLKTRVSSISKNSSLVPSNLVRSSASISSANTWPW